MSLKRRRPKSKAAASDATAIGDLARRRRSERAVPVAHRRAEPFDASVIWMSMALVMICALVYAPVRHFGFVSIDDPLYVRDNPNVTGGLTWQSVQWAFTTGRSANWHPLTWLSHMLDVQLFGVRPGWSHVIAVGFHAVNSVLVFVVLRRMTGAFWRAGAVAALFAVHPLHVESVAWIAERKDVLSTMFWLLAMWAYASYVEKRDALSYVWVLVALTLGLMSKPMLVSLPLVFLLCDVWPLGRTDAFIARVREKVPMLLIVAASSVVTFFAQRQGGAVTALDFLPLSSRLANAVLSYLVYLERTIWPAKLAIFYPYPSGLSVAFIVSLAIGFVIVTVAAVKVVARAPYVTVGWLWYVITLLPVIGVVQVGAQANADRYMYVPMIGLLIAAAWGTAAFAEWRRLPRLASIALLAVLVVACGVVTRAQLAYWSSNRALWTHALEVTTGNFRAHAAMGTVWLEEGNREQAIAEADEALRLSPHLPEAHNDMGVALAGLGKTAEAVPHYIDAIENRPDFVEAHRNLGLALMRLGQTDRAIEQYREVLRLDPLAAETHSDLGLALAGEKHINEAIAEYAEALRIEPGLAEAQNNMGFGLAELGRVTDAIPYFQEAVRLRPETTSFRLNLALTFAALDRKGEAIQQLREVLAREPGNARARQVLGMLGGTGGEPKA